MDLYVKIKQRIILIYDSSTPSLRTSSLIGALRLKDPNNFGYTLSISNEEFYGPAGSRGTKSRP